MRAITGLLKYHILSTLTAFQQQHCVTPGKFEVSVFDYTVNRETVDPVQLFPGIKKPGFRAVGTVS